MKRNANLGRQNRGWESKLGTILVGASVAYLLIYGFGKLLEWGGKSRTGAFVCFTVMGTVLFVIPVALVIGGFCELTGISFDDPNHDDWYPITVFAVALVAAMAWGSWGADHLGKMRRKILRRK